MIWRISARSKDGSKLPRRRITAITAAIAVPIAVAAIAPSSPPPADSRIRRAASASTGRAVSETTNAPGRRSSQIVMSASLKTSQKPARTAAQITSSASPGSPSNRSAIGSRASTTIAVPRRPSVAAQARPVPSVRCGEVETTFSSSSSSSSPSSSSAPKVRRIVPGLTSSDSSCVTRPARKSSSAKRPISLGPRYAATTITETSWIAFAITSVVPWTPE